MKIYICGDSTAASYTRDKAPQTGWGQALEELNLLPGTTIENRAMAGRSTRTFLAEGRLTEIEQEIAPGDLLLIQFAHNDESDKEERHTEPWGDFQDNLRVFLNTARGKGAIPVLVTPICMRIWQEGKLQDTHGEYLQAMRAVAEEEKVPLIDMYRESWETVNRMGEEESKKLFLHLEAGVYPAFPEGREDDAHTRWAGAEAWARIAAQGLKNLGLV